MSAPEIRTLPRPPSLGPLLLRGLAPRRRARGHGSAGRGEDGARKLNPVVYRTADQPIDGEHLAAYQRVCGFRTGDTLPATYLHVLVFPLTVARMVEPDFPFPLVGLVHVRNTIRQLRAVTASESVSFTVQALDLRPHPAGQQLDFVTEAHTGGDLVWSGRSTYLRRSQRPERGPRPVRGRDRTQEPTGPAARIRVPGDTGRRYAAVSGDRNPIHLSRLSARAFGFRRAIAHGMWLKARVLASLQGRLPDAYAVDVVFKTPVLLPSTVELLTRRDQDGWSLELHDARTGKPHLTGTVTPD